jgi:cystathionine beta-lyase/cystathionine gamma-synthase
MAAISAALGIHVKAGEHVLAHKTLYGCSYKLITHWLHRFGVEHTLCDFCNLDEVKQGMQPNTRVVFYETPCNPTMELIDIRAVSDIVKKANNSRKKEERIVSIVDNTFATPFCQRPITLGVDFVAHSLTKDIGGVGADMGGAVIGPRARETDLLQFRKDFGGSLSPKAAWEILAFGIPTLALRMERQQQNAMRIAEFLELHPQVKLVRYPGLDDFPQKELACQQMRDFDGNFAPGSMIYFELAGDASASYQRAIKVINHVADNALSITLAVSLGQIRTLMEHPASMTHSSVPPEAQEKAGIAPGGIRLSVGIEDTRDILSDLESALESV